MYRAFVLTVFATGLLMVSASPVHSQQGTPDGSSGGSGGATVIANLAGTPTAAVAASGTGTAERFWLRFDKDSKATMWLFVAGSWKRMDDPSRAVQDSVQEAFCMCKDTMEVVVWFEDSKITTIVVRSK